LSYGLDQSSEKIMVSSKLGALCERIIETGWLTVIVVTPLFFNMYSRRGFEADKLLLLRSIAAMMAAAWLIGWIEQRRTPRPSTASTLDRALRLPTLALVAVYLLTTITSITPRISFFGSYTRLQGTYTTISFVVIFLLILYGLRTRRQLNRLILAAILASLPVALYGVIQRYGLDPLGGPLDAASRVSATMGNPIYMAAYLVMVFFLTLGKIAASVRAIQGKALSVHLLRTISYICVAIAQLAAIVFSNSRGPFLGWLAGLVMLAALLSALMRRRVLTLGLIGLGLVGIVFLAVSNWPGSPLARLREIPYVGRLTNLAVNPGDTARVRILIWEGSANLIQPHEPLYLPDRAPDPLNLVRPLVGYGPESMYLVFGQSFPPALTFETGYAGSTLVGRSHNETWDSLVTGGVLGLLAYQFLFFGFFLYGLRAMGLMPTHHERNWFAGLWFGWGLAGGMAAILAGAPQYLGIGVPAGALVAIALYLLMIAFRIDRRSQPAAASRADQVMLAALLAGVLAHYVEIQFSFQVASTRLMFWVLAGLLAGVGSGRLGVEDALVEPVAPEAAERRNSSGQSVPWIGSLASWALVTSVLLLTLLYTLVTNAEQLSDPARIVWRALTFNALLGQESRAILIVLFSVWTLALVMLLAEMACSGMLLTRRDGLAAFVLYAALSLGPAVAFGLGFANQLSALTRSAAVWLAEVTLRADRYVSLFDNYAAGLFLLLALTAVVLMAENKSLPSAWSANRWSLVALAPVAVGAYLLVNVYNLNSIRADVIYQRGQVYDMVKNWDFAIALDKRAISLAPDEDVYYRGLGRAFLEKAASASGDVAASAPLFDEQASLEKIWQLDAEQTAGLGRDDLFYAARAVFARGRAINPLNADHTAGLALVYQRWAATTTDAEQRMRLAEQSSQYYAQAVRLAPRDAQLWKEWEMARQMYQSAVDALDKSRTP